MRDGNDVRNCEILIKLCCCNELFHLDDPCQCCHTKMSRMVGKEAVKLRQGIELQK